VSGVFSPAELPRQVAFYVAVGVIGTAVDFAFFWLLLRLHAQPAVAVTVAFAIATALQFFLNRHWSFRAFHRSALRQAGAYGVVVVASWLVNLTFVEAGIGVFHLTPLFAKALAIAPSAVLGFVGNRYLTFGRGIRGTVRLLRDKMHS
jgi:putative flippase GtrA